MANNTLTTSIICKTALAVLENELGVVNALYRAHEDEFDKKVNGYAVGDTVSIRRPADFTVRTGATMNLQDVIEGKVDLSVDQQVGVDFNFTSSDMTLKVEDMAERIIKPAMSRLVNYVLNDCFSTMYKRVYNWVGAPNADINSYADFALAPERLDEMAVPSDSRLGVLSPHDHWGLVGSQTSLFSPSLVGSAYQKGVLPDVGGVELYKSQLIPTHTTGVRTNATGPGQTNGASQEVTYDSVKNAWTQSLATNNHPTTWTWKEGDVFTLVGCYMVNPATKQSTGILQQFVVCADATANATTASNTTLTVSPPIIFSGPHQTVTLSGVASTDDLTLTNIGTASTAYRQNMVFHKNTMALAIVPMQMPQGVTGAVRESYKGLSARLIPGYDIVNDVSRFRFDLLYGRKPIDPRIATRLSGT
jgi:hypothetical protein